MFLKHKAEAVYNDLYDLITLEGRSPAMMFRPR